jgi:hypothetical protein
MSKMHNCQIPDCPFHTGGECWLNLSSTAKEVVRELRTTRTIYYRFQADGLFASKETWYAIIGVLNDRIEQLTKGSQI